MNRYLEMLQNENKDLYEAAFYMQQRNGSIANQVMSCVGAPMIYLYVSWVLEEARKRQIKRLYFLARDGQIFYEIARIICKERNLDIECRYLYCSRIAWRVPQYFLLKEKCLDYICQRSMNLTIKKMLDRILFSEKEMQEACKYLDIEQLQLECSLDFAEVKALQYKMASSKPFMNMVYDISKREYECAKRYLEQEGMLDKEKKALVDTGWVGSMQQSLKMLVESITHEEYDIYGFYFGMFRTPEIDKERYYPYYFSANGDLQRKASFNNNLLECMCGSDDGMTLCYREEHGRMQPVFSTSKNLNQEKWNIKKNHDIVCKFTEYMLLNSQAEPIPKEAACKIIQKLTNMFMVHPSTAEAELYGNYLFSDDVTEKGVIELAPKLETKELFGEDFIPKIYKRLFVKDIRKRQTKSFWIEGSIERSYTSFKGWHRFNAWLWHLLQYAVYSR